MAGRGATKVRWKVPVHEPELPFPPSVAGPAAVAPATCGSGSSPFGVFECCPMCGADMAPEHAHFRCTSCGWRDSCCD